MKRLFLIRHGESTGNLDETLHYTHAGHTHELSPKGAEQAFEAGQKLATFSETLNDDAQTKIWHSPYKRARQTKIEICRTLSSISRIEEEPFLAELDFGLFEGLTSQEKQERFPNERYIYKRARQGQGEYWARMPHGESPFDVDVRLTPVRAAIDKDYESGVANTVVISHATIVRLFLMRYLRISFEDFNETPNPGHASIRLLENSGYGWSDMGFL